MHPFNCSCVLGLVFSLTPVPLLVVMFVCALVIFFLGFNKFNCQKNKEALPCGKPQEISPNLFSKHYVKERDMLKLKKQLVDGN